MDSAKAIIMFGAGPLASLMTRYIEKYTDWEIAAYTVERPFCFDETFCGKPLVSFDEISALYLPSEHDAFVSVGYKQLGNIRKKAFLNLKQQGYSVRNFIHPSVENNLDDIGEGNIILEGTVLGFGSVIGDANYIPATNFAHDSVMGSFNSTCGAVIGGFVKIGDNCFFGLNSTIIDGLSIESNTFVAAGTTLRKNSVGNRAFCAKESLSEIELTSKTVDLLLR